MDETDIRAEKNWWQRKLGEKTIASLKRRNICAEYVSDRHGALSKVLGLIAKDATVGWGDSVTLHQIGIITELEKTRRHSVLNAFRASTSREILALMRKAMTADVFITGVNAITLDGKLVSVDALGNRVAAMIFGPKRVIVVAGINKIVRNLDEAINRIKEVAIINARRHVVKHDIQSFGNLPCAKTGLCTDCFHPDRICRYTVVIDGEREPSFASFEDGVELRAEESYTPRIHVIIVGEELGI